MTKVRAGGSAEATGQVKVDQRILSVDGNSIDGLAKEQVTNLIKACHGTVNMSLADDEYGCAAFRAYQANRSSSSSLSSLVEPLSPLPSDSNAEVDHDAAAASNKRLSNPLWPNAMQLGVDGSITHNASPGTCCAVSARGDRAICQFIYRRVCAYVCVCVSLCVSHVCVGSLPACVMC